jgi:hypothetical protein
MGPTTRAAPRALAAALAVVAGLGLVACGGDDDGDDAPATTGAAAPPTSVAAEPEELVPLRQLVTRPDLTPPVIDVRTSESTTPGYLFLAPKQAGAQAGPLIVDDAGEVVWSNPRPGSVTDFRVQTYDGEPVLTWWEGEALGGYGAGEFVIVDDEYREVARVAAGDRLDGDEHEFQLTDDGTALIMAYDRQPADLSEVDGPADGYVLDNRIREIDVETGEVLFDWSALDDVPLADSYSELVPDAAATPAPLDDDGSAEAPYDWFHANSVGEGPDGTLLVSARNTHAVYALDRESGEVAWQLGGRSPDVAVAGAPTFAWQHDARLLADGTISLFDNEADPPVGEASRALVLDVDVDAGTASVVRDVTHPDGVLAGSQGNVQALDGGGLLVGWGSRGRVTEFGPDDAVVYDATWAPADSYRVYRLPWVGHPPTTPDVVVRRAGAGSGAGSTGSTGSTASTGSDATDATAGGGGLEVVVSWNGATEVASWRVLAGESRSADALPEVATAERDGFETVIPLPAPTDTVVVEALDADGETLARSEPVEGDA